MANLKQIILDKLSITQPIPEYTILAALREQGVIVSPVELHMTLGQLDTAKLVECEKSGRGGRNRSYRKVVNVR